MVTGTIRVGDGGRELRSFSSSSDAAESPLSEVLHPNKRGIAEGTHCASPARGGAHLPHRAQDTVKRARSHQDLASVVMIFNGVPRLHSVIWREALDTPQEAC
uniref:Uncharacterized protein n=1 Tax=Hemiselmis andersenii TaxID=464988 RepID=A0A6T8LN27_HEMAN